MAIAYQYAAMWIALSRLPWVWRCLVKGLLLSAVVVFVLFPHPKRLLTQIKHLRNVESLIQPDLPEIAEINERIDQQLADRGDRKQEFRLVERYVYQAIPYKFDWFNWGNLDYWPTAKEVLERKTEDCDGRAVLATSILRARGFKTARIVANLDHVWVAVDDAELMSPQADKNLQRAGTKTAITFPALRTWLSAGSKVCKFPAARSLIILAAILVLAYHPCRSFTGFLAVSTVSLIGFVLLVDWASRFDPRGATLVSTQLGVAIGLSAVAIGFALFANRFFARRANASVKNATAPETNFPVTSPILGENA